VGEPRLGDGEFGSPSGSAVDSIGAVCVTDSGNERVQKFVAITGPTPTVLIRSRQGRPGSA